uniref:IQ motif and ubiquitin-like domain-containing protein n=1 Tax=Glossina morsitans morsitans TaxID=37546 RepID=A0A1B0FHY6_GLOMM
MNCENKLANVSEVVFQPPPPRSTDCEKVAVKRPTPKERKESSPLVVAEQKNLSVDDDNCKNATVKFQFNGNQVIAQTYPLCISLGEIKADLARRFDVDTELLILSQCSRVQSDDCTLSQTCINDYHIYEFDLKLKARKKQKKIGKYEKNKRENEEDQPVLDFDVYYSKHRLPNFITICMEKNEELCHIPVVIHDEAIVKPVLCSYIDKTTGLVYTDAFTQTGPLFDKQKYENYVSRNTQTKEIVTKQIDTMHDQTAQCFLDGNNVRHWIESDDYYITPGKYQTYAKKMREERRMYKIILIQRNFRRFKWQRWMRECAAEYRRLVANRISEEEAFKKEQEMRISREQRAKQFPRTKNDFDMLLGEVQKWKIAEMKRINNMYEGAPRIAEINILLNKEIEMLNNIECQRNLVYKSMEDSRQRQLLRKMGEPIKWIGYADTVIHMDLLRTQRVRFLNGIHNELCQNLPKEERLQLIDKVRALLLDEQCFPEFPELFELLDRERNLLMYTTCADVSILRKRQNILFIELIKFTEEPLPKSQDNRMCMVCKLVKPYSKFAIRTRQYHVDTCKKCFYLKVSPAENLIYTSILRSIQREERRKRCNGSFAFILQMEDIRYLIREVWHGHSILSKCENIQRLRLPRWRKNEEWSPWNCVCLTENEARNHYRISELETTYDKKLILEVGNRQKLARSAFHNLAAASTEFTETGIWWKVGLNHQRIVKLDEITSYKGADTLLPRKLDDRNYRIGKIL